MRIANSDGHPGQIIAQELVAGFVERQADGLFNDAAQSGANAGHAVNAFVDDLLPSGGGGSASSYQQAINSVVDQMGQTLTPNALASGSVAGLEVMAPAGAEPGENQDNNVYPSVEQQSITADSPAPVFDPDGMNPNSNAYINPESSAFDAQEPLNIT